MQVRIRWWWSKWRLIAVLLVGAGFADAQFRRVCSKSN